MTAASAWLDNLSATEREGLEHLVSRFEQAWQEGRRPQIDDYLMDRPAQRLALLIELVQADLEQRLQAGEPVRVDGYLTRFPELLEVRPAVLALLSHEYRARCRREPDLDLTEYLRRFPQYHAELAQMRQPSPTATPDEPATLPPQVAAAEVLTLPPGPTAERAALLSACLQRWYDLRQQGQAATPEDVCQDCPDLLGEVKHRIKDVAAVEALLEGVNAQTSRDWSAASSLESEARRGTPATPTVIQVPGYEILGELGRGGMGVVYKARHRQLNRIVALKMVLAGGHSGSAERIRFLAEAEAVAALQHPNVVQVFEFGQHDGLPYMALEFVNGGSLAGRLRDGLPQPKEAAWLLEQLARGMAAAHAKGIIHRDLKPHNVLLAAPPGSAPEQAALQLCTPKVTDFGLAKRVEGGSGLTQTGAVMGTPSYMAPEQAEGKKDVGPPADTYALGAILYECLTGRPPFRGSTPLDTILQVVADEPAPVRQLQPSCPRDLETICHKCLQKDPAKRYAGALELAEDLQRFQAGLPVQARPVGSMERGWRWCRRNPVVAGLAATVALVLVLGAGVATFFAVRAGQHADQANRNADKARVEAERADQEARQAEKDAEAARLAGIAERKAAEQAREAEGQAKKDAERARLAGLAEQKAAEQARKDRDLAKEAEKRKEVQLGRAEWAAYLNRITQAQVEWEHGSTAQARDHLEACQWNLRGWEHRYLLTQFNKYAPLKGHTGAVTSVSFSPDGKRIVSGSHDNTVKVWDADKGTETFTLKGHTHTVSSVSYSPDGKHIVSGSLDNTLKVWDADKGSEILTLKGHTGEVTSVSFSPDGKRIVSGSNDKTLKVWDSDKGTEILSLKGHSGWVRSVSFSPDGKRIVSGSGGFDALGKPQPGELKVWDADKGSETLSLKGHIWEVSSVAFSPDGKRIVSGSMDEVVKVWDADKGSETLSLKGHEGGVSSVAFSPDGKRISSGSGRWDAQGRIWKGEVKVWDADKGTKALTLKGHTSGVLSVAFSPDGKRIVSGSVDKTLKVWDADKGSETLSLMGHTDVVRSVSFSLDGKRIVSGSADGTLKVWNVDKGTEILSLKGHSGWVRSVSFSPDGKRIVSGSGGFDALGKPQPGELKVWDADKGSEILTLKGHTSEVSSVSFSLDGKRIVSASGGFDPVTRKAFGEVKVWDADKDTETLSLKGHTGGVSSVAFSPDGKRIVSGNADGTVKVWDADKGSEILTLKGHTSYVTSVSYSPDGKRIVSGSRDMTLKVWDADKGSETLTLKGHTSEVTSVSYSPDGKRIVSGSRDKTLKVWDADKGSETLTLKGHVWEVHSVSFSPDGNRIVSGGDTTLKVWDADKEGTESHTLKGHTLPVRSVSFSPDGKRIVSASGDPFYPGKPGEMKVWDADKGTETLSLKGHTDRVTSVSFSPDGERIVSASSDNTVKVWDADKGSETLSLKGYFGSVAFSPDGKRIVSGSGSTVQVWDADKGTETLSLKGHTDRVTSVSFSPDGKRIVSASADKTLKVWDADKGTGTLTLKGHTGGVSSVAFSPDGKRIVSASGGDVKVWDADKGTEILAIKGAGDSVSFSPDGKRFVSASGGDVKVWDADKGSEVLTLKGHTGGVSSVAFSPDGKRIVSGNSDYTLKVWDADKGTETAAPR